MASDFLKIFPVNNNIYNLVKNFFCFIISREQTIASVVVVSLASWFKQGNLIIGKFHVSYKLHLSFLIRIFR